MRPYRFKMRLSSRRLNVTRLGKAPAAALRAAARTSLGSVSSDIELIAHLLVSTSMPLFRKPESILRYRGSSGRDHAVSDMIAPTGLRRKRGADGNAGLAG